MSVQIITEYEVAIALSSNAAATQYIYFGAIM
jgi:hypothetical protein